MTLNEVEREEFEKLLYNFVAKHGPEPLKDLFRLRKVFKKITRSAHLPISQMYYHFLYLELQKEEYQKLSFHDKIQLLKHNQALSHLTVNAFIHSYYLPKINSIRKIGKVSSSY